MRERMPPSHQLLGYSPCCQQIELSGVIANELSGFGLCFHLDK
jgi:hypothetical protein